MRQLRYRETILLLALCLAGCGGGSGGGMSFTDDRGIGEQPFPNNYRAELLAFFKTYLTNPVGVREAAMAEPMQRTVGGRQRYVSCLRYSPRGSDGSYSPARDRAVIYVDGRLDRLIEDGRETCAGAIYAPFPELEKLDRSGTVQAPVRTN